MNERKDAAFYISAFVSLFKNRGECMKNLSYTAAYSSWLFILVCLLFSAPSLAIVDKENDGGLHDTYFKSFWVADKISFPSEKKIYVAQVEVAFSSAWLTEFEPETTPAYRERIKSSYGKEMHSQLTEHLSRAGWIVVSEPDENSLTMRAKLDDIYIVAPQTGVFKNSLVSYIGKSDLKIELIGTDANTILKVEDGRVVEGLGNAFIETNRAVNYSRFKKLMVHWANVITPYLDLIADIAEAKD